MMKKAIGLMMILTGLLISCDKEEETPPPANNNTTPPIDTLRYTDDIQPMISTYCTVTCHTPTKTTGFFNADLSTYAGVKVEVDAGTFENRVIVQKTMPPGGPLPTDSIQKLQKWLDTGALE